MNKENNVEVIENEEKNSLGKKIKKWAYDNAENIAGALTCALTVGLSVVLPIGIIATETNKAKKEAAERADLQSRLYSDEESGYIVELKSAMSNDDLLEFQKIKREENLSNLETMRRLGKF